ncbi:caspase, EACC1-associated type [Streptomyces sp. TLI_171]|uniref:caspase, EACC1-associated type n=1 Tax=Streptomyces sp. TLI_171 TaxID=1938859 RepID=UPI000C1826AD|nr:caspase family protein [Streptomyces sp. TLI_171]RKE18533.1 caspase domain-containing protein [Streptomyces sp. TLI_171]
MSHRVLRPDPAGSWAVLIAVGRYADLPDMPEAVASMELLADQLSGPAGGFEPSQVLRVVDPESAREVADRIAAVAARATDTLLVHYAGHGVTSAAGRLHLGLPGTLDDPDHVPRTALPAGVLLAALGQRAAHRVAVLDCCFAGLAMDEPAAADVHLLTAVDRARKALLNKDTGLTRFGEELLRLCRDGIPDGPAHLPLDLVHHHLAVALAQIPADAPRRYQAPVPQQRTVDSTGHLALFRNPAHGTACTEPGLRARAAFAYRQFAVRLQRQPWHRPQAVALLADVSDDAARSLGPDHPLTLQLANAHGHAVGLLHGSAAALALLEPLAVRAAARLPAGSPELATIDETVRGWLGRSAQA